VATGENASRWATFDCYGTLVDWNGGIRDQLARLFGTERSGALLERYHEVEPRVEEAKPGAPYREVMAECLAACAEAAGAELPEGERDALGRSLPSWPVFSEVPDALAELRRCGFRLVILSNTDRDFIESSMEAIGVPFELAIVASEIGSYKPAEGHWREFFERTGAERERHVHVAASLFHDVEPCERLGIPCVWINRLSETVEHRPVAELADHSALPDTLDGVVPA
jgi:2-haloacid dehalogenase